MTTAACRGFVYATAVMGVTGARTTTSDLAGPLVARTKATTDLPVCVGLGVSTGDQAAEVASYADGVIVGSAFVRTLLDHADDPAAGLVRAARAHRGPGGRGASCVGPPGGRGDGPAVRASCSPAAEAPRAATRSSPARCSTRRSRSTGTPLATDHREDARTASPTTPTSPADAGLLRLHAAAPTSAALVMSNLTTGLNQLDDDGPGPGRRRLRHHRPEARTPRRAARVPRPATTEQACDGLDRARSTTIAAVGQAAGHRRREGREARRAAGYDVEPRHPGHRASTAADQAPAFWDQDDLRRPSVRPTSRPS